jgi:hypothetical protein
MTTRSRVAGVSRRLLPVLGALAACALLFVGGSNARSDAARESGVISSITDGDTIRLTNGNRVRLLQIDTPELGSGECYSRAARRVLAALAPVGTPVFLEADPSLDRVERYEREPRARPTRSRCPVFLSRRARPVRDAAAQCGPVGQGGKARSLGRVPVNGTRSKSCSRYRSERAAGAATSCVEQLRSELLRWLRSAVSARCRLCRYQRAGHRPRSRNRDRRASSRRRP